MNKNKRKKTSGLTGLELRMAYNSLVNVKSMLFREDASTDLQSQENLITFDLDFEETLAKMLDGPQVRHIPLANMTFLIVSYRHFLSLA
jgi:hypothetical protein